MSQTRAPRVARQAAAAPTDADLINFTLPPDLLARLDEARGGLSRSDAVATVIVGLLRGTAEIVATQRKPASPEASPAAGSPPAAPSPHADPLPAGRRPDAIPAPDTCPTGERLAARSAVAAAGRPAALASVANDVVPAAGKSGETVATDPAAGPAAADTATGSIEGTDFAHDYFRMLEAPEAAPATVVRRTDRGTTRSRLFPRGGKRTAAGATASKQKGPAGQLVNRVAAASRPPAGKPAATGRSVSGRRIGLIAAGGLAVGGLLGSTALNFWLIDENGAVEAASHAVQVDRTALQQQVARAAAQSRDLAEKVRLLERSLQTAKADLRLLRGNQYSRDVAATRPAAPTTARTGVPQVGSAPQPAGIDLAGAGSANAFPTHLAATHPAPLRAAPAHTDTAPRPYRIEAATPTTAAGQVPVLPAPPPVNRLSPALMPSPIAAAVVPQRSGGPPDRPAVSIPGGATPGIARPGIAGSALTDPPPLAIIAPRPQTVPRPQPTGRNDPLPPARPVMTADRPLPAIPRPKPPVPAALRNRPAVLAGTVVIQPSPRPGSPGLASQGLVPQDLPSQLVPQAMAGGSGPAPLSGTSQADPARDSVRLAPPAASIGGARRSRLEMITDPYRGLRSRLPEN